MLGFLGTVGDTGGLRCFSGSSVLTAAFLGVGLEMLDPVDVKLGMDLSARANVDMLISMLRNGDVDWVWLAPPCTSHSAAQNGRRGGPLRTKTQPRGVDLALPLVVMGNFLEGVALELFQIAAILGIHATIEHPATSYAWI